MAKNISTVTVNASKERVWDVITKPELVKQWQYGSNLITEWSVGSNIRFITEWEGKVLEQWGTVIEYKPFGLLAYSLFAPRPGLEDKAENYFVMRYVLHEEDGKTRLQIIKEDNRPDAVQQQTQVEENPILQALKKVAEVRD